MTHSDTSFAAFNPCPNPTFSIFLDHFGYVSANAGKPMIYQSGQSGPQTAHFDPPHHFLPFEMEWIRDHPSVSCFNLFETASFFRLNDDGIYEGSPHLRELVPRHRELGSRSIS